MIDISVKNLIKAFEVDKNILDGLSFEINSGEKVCLLGKNGAGKTTLFRLLVGEISEDEGDIVIAPGKRIGLISQIPNYPEYYTTEDVLRDAHSTVYKIGRRMEELSHLMTDDSSPEILNEYGRLSADFDMLGGYSIEIERNKVANGLDISPAMRTQLFSSLSGGEKTRVNLARLILEDTDILLLDEPTNHLDLNATEWLEEYLLKFKGSVLAISHDRFFLDRIAGRTIDLVNGKAEFYSGNYSFYVIEKQRRYDEQLKQYEKEQKEIKRLDESARRLYQWGTGNEMLMKKSFAIRSRIERMQKTDRPEHEKNMKTRFSSKDFRGDEVLLVRDLSKSYDERKLFETPELLIQGGERIALIGDNGTGKSTFIKLIMGEEVPDSGFCRRGPSVKTAYLPQIVSFESENRSVLDTVIYETNCTPQTARNRLGAYKFSGEDVFKPVWALSGGEKSRLRLCILMNEEISFLILDEPTNHLDVSSREWIEECLEEYDETLLFISHDRYFISRFATRIWELSDGTITDYRGSFDEYRQLKERQKNLQQIVKKDTKSKDNRKKASMSVEKQLLKLEREIEKAEERINSFDIEIETFASDYEKLLELSEKRLSAEAELDELYLRWEELSV